MVNYIALDLETTGLSPYVNEITQIGAWKIKNGVIVDKFDTLVKPIQYIPRNIEILTGITNDMVSDAPCIEEVLPAFVTFCEDLPFLGHNLPFDYSFLVIWGKKCGLDITLNNTRLGIDTLKLSRKYFPNLKSYKLEEMVKTFNISIGTESKFHNACYDSYMTKLLYDRFILNPDTAHGSRLPEVIGDKKKQVGHIVSNGTLSFD